MARAFRSNAPGFAKTSTQARPKVGQDFAAPAPGGAFTR
jgi:hypothetical protein